MSNKPLVSVIMPFLNLEKFIEEAIESVFAQTCYNWELMLVDDASTDGGTAIARQYAEQHPEKVFYLEHEGHQSRGASASRNLGIRHAKGAYIAFLDADDVYLPHKLEQQVAILDVRPEAAMVYGNTQYWYSWTGQGEDLQRDYVPKLGIQPNSLVKPPTLLPLFLQQKAALPCTCSVLVRREVIDDIGGFEESFQRIYTDQVFYAKLCLKFPVFVASECWDKYRRHPDSTCSIEKKRGRYQAARQTYLNWMADYLSDQGFKDSQVWRVLQKELWRYHHPHLHHYSQHAQRFMKRLKTSLKQTARWILPPFIYRHGHPTETRNERN
jgi:glycosyltransferase involved in cell wall biosynthesis